MGNEKLTERQEQLYNKICEVDPTWNKDSFSLACNTIITLGNLLKVESGLVSVLFDNSNFASLKLEKNDKTIIEEKIYFNDWVKTKSNSTGIIAENIRSMAEQLLVASNT